jgi:hypothetical protein
MWTRLDCDVTLSVVELPERLPVLFVRVLSHHRELNVQRYIATGLGDRRSDLKPVLLRHDRLKRRQRDSDGRQSAHIAGSRGAARFVVLVGLPRACVLGKQCLRLELRPRVGQGTP